MNEEEGKTRERAGAPGPGEAETRERLLAAGARLFSKNGFRRVTVRDLCREAGANVSAVNYHFGDKLGLYRQVVEDALETIRDADPTAEAPPDAPPEVRIRHYVQSFLPALARPTGPAIWLQRLMAHEMQEPTPLAPWIAERVILPRVRYLVETVAELLDLRADHPRVERCVQSVQAQCLFYVPNRFRRAALPGWHELTDDELAAVAEHIVTFSLAGMGAGTEPGTEAAGHGR